MNRLGLIAIVLAPIVTGGYFAMRETGDDQVVNNQALQSATPTATVLPEKIFAEPISNSIERATKKPFGIYITPSNSPIKPERFSGYHTGIDFEIFPKEEELNISVYAVCDGKLLRKTTINGYGGVIVLGCVHEGEPITIVYGHIKLTSIKTVVGQRLLKGQPIAVLGKGFSTETGGERKHLHLGVHKGPEINFRGYVQNSSGLNDWLDIMKFL